MESSFHIIDADAISKIKDGVIIINMGRGPLVDETALIDGLKRKDPCCRSGRI